MARCGNLKLPVVRLANRREGNTIEREVLCQAAHKEMFVCGVRAAPPSLMPAVHAAGLRQGDGFQRRVAAFRSTSGWGIDGGGIMDVMASCMNASLWSCEQRRIVMPSEVVRVGWRREERDGLVDRSIDPHLFIAAHASTSVWHTTCSIQHTIHIIQHTSYSMQHMAHGTWHATCSMRHAACASCGIRHATCGMQHAACSIQLPT